MVQFDINFVTQDDVSLLWDVLYEICCDRFWRGVANRALRKEENLPSRLVLEKPELAKYVDDWGRTGDEGLVMINSENQEVIGAAWYRLFKEKDKSFGFIDESTPEMAIALFSSYRGQGLGQVLLTHLLQRATLSCYKQISLNVDPENYPALHLYQKLGFQKVGTIKTNWIMKKALTST